MQTYALIIKEIFKANASDIKLALFYLEGSELVSANFDDNTLENCKKILIQTYNKIKNKDPDTVTGNVGSHCVRCDYSDICPFYRKK
jgi:CRISPR/Cas system-associated exonuclease Cas4 (RecB family)